MRVKIKVAVVIAFLILLGVIHIFYRLPFVAVHPHAAIPHHAALFFSFKPILAEPAGLPVHSSLFLPANFTEDYRSFVDMFGTTLPLPPDEPVHFSVHPTKSSGIDLLFVSPGFRGTDLGSKLASNPEWRVRSSHFNNFEIFTVKYADRHFALAKYRNLLIFAHHSYLVENAISQLAQPTTSLCKNPAFRKLYRQLDKPGENWQSYLQVSQINSQFAPLIRPGKAAAIDGAADFGEWMQFTLPTANNDPGWTGHFIANPGNLLMAANRAASASPFSSSLNALPDNLSGFAWLAIDKINLSEGSNPWHRALDPWIGDEIVFASGEPMADDQSEQFILLKTNDAATAEKSLEALAGKMGKLDQFQFQLFNVWQIRKERGDEVHGIELFENPYVTVLGDYVLFANSRSGLERWLVKYLAGQTFSQHVGFLQHLGKLPGSGHALMYVTSAKGWQLLASLLNEDYLLSMNKNPFPFQQVLMSLTWNGNVADLLFSTSGPNQDAGQPANILWNTPLGSQAAGKPAVFVNPQNGEPEIFIQDEAHVIYLFSRTGRTLMRRQLDEPIRSAVTQVDLYNQQEGQFAFSTRSAIYVVDRSGLDVAGFPLKLQVPASNGVAVVDFFQSNDYNFFIACENGKAYGFDEKGSPVEGWRPHDGVGLVKHPMLHFQATGRDFLVWLTEDGVLRVFQKNGKERFPPVTFPSGNLQMPAYQATKGSSRIVTSDHNGRVYVVNFSGEHFRLQLKAGDNKDVCFAFADVLGDERKDYLAVSGGYLAAYYYDKNKFRRAFDHRFTFPNDEIFEVKWEGKRKSYIGLLSKSRRKILLMDGMGRIPGQFPLEGTTPFAIYDLLGDGKPVVITGNGSNITAYSLE